MERKVMTLTRGGLSGTPKDSVTRVQARDRKALLNGQKSAEVVV